MKHCKDGNRDITNLHYSSGPRTATTECNEQEVDALNTENQRVIIRKITVQFHIEHTAMQEMRETLGYWKDFCHSVP